MAGFNYSNKNPSSVFTNQDLLKGYSASVSSSILVAVALRKFFNRAMMGRSARSGSSAMLMANTIVAAVSCSAASYVNTTMMRRPEAKVGIPIYSSPCMSEDKRIGISKVCAEQAISETAQSRVALASSCCVMPALFLTPLAHLPVFGSVYRRMGQKSLQAIQLFVIIASSWIGLAGASSIFQPVS